MGMATYIIGDVHGCFETLGRLLAAIEFNLVEDRIFLTGDLVNGGPQSAAVVRWAMRHRAGVVLGNHDLHLLAVASGARPPRESDTFFDLLQAEDAELLLQWLRTRPLLISEEGFLLVHAGLWSGWDEATAQGLAREAERAIRGPSKGTEADFFQAMYGDEPRRWDSDLVGVDRIRVIINAMTRMRMVEADGTFDLGYKGPVDGVLEGLRPWFAESPCLPREKPIFFGHWAALGFHRGGNVIGLDSGCVWGGRLTGWRLEDGRVFQVASELAPTPF
jgi:bis(5'-nucleosyl)-tetraphosphatase (symmetrical)